MTRFARFCAIAIVTLATTANARQPVPFKGKDVSFLYNLSSVVEAHTPLDTVRVFGIGVPKAAEIRTVLQVIADARPPEMNKISRVLMWELDTSMRRIDAVRLDDTLITISGWGYEKGSITCRYRFHHEKGLLVGALEELGCG